MTLIYLPLESYPERYTYQLSTSKTGWLERNWIKVGIEYKRIDSVASATAPIRTGVVLDAERRCAHSFAQVQQLIAMIGTGELRSDDKILFDDFWHPGIEAIPYAWQMFRSEPLPHMYAVLYAQSVDQWDFTAPMCDWMRPFEHAIGNVLDGIFVATPMLRDLVVGGGIAAHHKVHPVGLIFDSEEVMSRMPVWYQNMIAHPGLDKGHARRNKVVFSSRWDTEKDPLFFLNVIDAVLIANPFVNFTICTSAPKLRSNDPALLDALVAAMSKYPGSVIVRQGLSKEAYYAELCSAKVQFNCAKQDWISFTLLEASTAGCVPVYPFYRSFPETFLRKRKYMYDWQNVRNAADHILEIISHDDLWTWDAIDERRWIHSRFDTTWFRMAQHMGLQEGVPDDPFAG